MTILPRSPGIYIITCVPNKRIYIGSSVNMRGRYASHKSRLAIGTHSNRHLQNAWNKYGEDAFVFEVLELVMPWSLTDREQYWLDTLRPFGKQGFNISPVAGNCLGVKHTAETRAKISKARTGKKLTFTDEHCSNISAGLKGRVRSPEHCANISAAKKGKPVTNKGHKHTEETRAKMSAAKKGRVLSAEHQAKITASIKATWAKKKQLAKKREDSE